MSPVRAEKLKGWLKRGGVRKKTGKLILRGKDNIDKRRGGDKRKLGGGGAKGSSGSQREVIDLHKIKGKRL